jgi:hypothetical protein
MNDYKVKGLIKVISDTVQVTEKFSKASFNLRGREWQDKHFNSLELWKIELLTAAAVAPAHVPDQPGDDLPF